MRQVWVTRTGSPDVLQSREAPLPQPAAGEVRVRVAAAGVNFADIVGRQGRNPDAPRAPYVPGYEVAGTVEALGEGVSTPPVGERVIAVVRAGGYSEVVCVPIGQTLPMPAPLTWEQAAAFPTSYLTAYAALVALAGIKPGERVLLHAAAGGLGLAALQIARQFDAIIYGTASLGKHDYLRAQGVEPIDYRQHDFHAAIMALTGGAGVHIALDSIGGRSWPKSYRSLTPLGRLANDNKGVMGVNMAHLFGELAMLRAWGGVLLGWVEEGKLSPVVDRAFPLEEAAAAHRYLHERRNIGKVVLVP